jgi:hypothetical protein
MHSIFRAIVLALATPNLVAVSEANAQTRGDEAAIGQAVDAMTIGRPQASRRQMRTS